jgi:DNA-binding MarR family transcriptional regulator
MTATQLGKITGLKLESLSSVLKKMVDAGLLERVGGFGPRGGYGYTVVKEKP